MRYRRIGRARCASTGRRAGNGCLQLRLCHLQVLSKASASAFRGGVAGFAAGVIQVGSFMWLRTAMNYQYVNGGNLVQACSALYKARPRPARPIPEASAPYRHPMCAPGSWGGRGVPDASCSGR